MLVRAEIGRHLLIRVYIVSEVAQRVAELLHVLPEQIKITSDVDEIIQRPVLKLFHFPELVSRANSRLVELPCFCTCNSEQYALERASTKENDR